MNALFLIGLVPLLFYTTFANDDENRGGTASSLKAELITLPSGLQYRVLKTGEGKKPGANSKVTVHFVGTLENGKVVDSSRKRGKPSEFPMNRVIAGWTEGLQLMSAGATYELIIPPNLGYGNRKNGPIPANSTTIWEVELLSFVE